MRICNKGGPIEERVGTFECTCIAVASSENLKVLIHYIVCTCHSQLGAFHQQHCAFESYRRLSFLIYRGFVPYETTLNLCFRPSIVTLQVSTQDTRARGAHKTALQTRMSAEEHLTLSEFKQDRLLKMQAANELFNRVHQQKVPHQAATRPVTAKAAGYAGMLNSDDLARYFLT